MFDSSALRPFFFISSLVITSLAMGSQNSRADDCLIAGIRTKIHKLSNGITKLSTNAEVMKAPLLQVTKSLRQILTSSNHQHNVSLRTQHGI